MFHDINKKQTDFGVWKLWDELKAQYPHFEFLHGHGLGLIAVGKNRPQELSWLFEANDKEILAIQNFFFLLGSRLTDKMSAGVDNTSTAIPLSGAEEDWLGLRVEVEDLRGARAELEDIRRSIYFRLAWKLRAFVNTVLPVGSRRRGFLERLLNRVKSLFARKVRHLVKEPINIRVELAHKYLRGIGLAIGAPPTDLMPQNVIVDFTDAPNYDTLSELENLEPGNPLAGENMHRVRLAEIGDEVYDFVVCSKFPKNLSTPGESLNLWLRAVKPGGILYSATPMDGILSNHILDWQFEGAEIKILESAENLVNDGKEQIYIIEKANYISKIFEALQKNPDLNIEYLLDVVVPIYNAYEDLERCLYSLFKHQDIYRVILINDCSTDQRIKELLNALREHQGERLK